MLVLVRHGQTVWNAEGRLSGRADVDLTDLGRRQAMALNDIVVAPARVVSSPLRRARDTAAVFGLPVEVDDRWIELDYGEHDGVRQRDVPAALWQEWRRDPAWTPPGGESLLTVGRRVRAACEGLAAEAAERDVVVVTHVSPIKAALAWALGVGDEVAWRLWVEVASVSRIGFARGQPVVRSFNECHHLVAIGS